MRIRSFLQHDLDRLTELTIETFGPFYEESFRPLVGEIVFANQHGKWRDDYVKQVAVLHDPPSTGTSRSLRSTVPSPVTWPGP